MAKADDRTSTEQILLREARRLLVDYLGSPPPAEEMLKWIPWRSRLAGAADPDFLRSCPAQYDFEGSKARALVRVSGTGEQIYGPWHHAITVSRADVPVPLMETAAGEPKSPPERRKAGVKPKYDWDVIRARCDGWFGEDGYPDNVSAFCQDELIPWCVEKLGEGGTPNSETLRPLVTKWIDAWKRSLDPQ